MSRRPWPAVLIAASCVAAISLVANFGGGEPALAGEARARAASAANASWRAFAADLASASGCVVSYEAPMRGSVVDGQPAPAWAADLGGIGMLRVGALEGPSVLVFPEHFLDGGQVASAYAQVGLKEPRRFAQDLVAKITFEQLEAANSSVSAEDASAEAESLSTLLRDSSVLIPVFLQHGTRSQRAGGPSLNASLNPSLGSPQHNFPARWEDAAAAAPDAAGPYPASHPSVRAMTSWFHGATDCAGVVMVRASAGNAQSGEPFEAGTLEAFCGEVLELNVAEATHEGCELAIQRALEAAPKLAFREPLWTRLGSTNWSLEVTVERHGGGRTRGDAVLLAADSVEGDITLTAAAASTGDGSLELLPLRTEGVLLQGMAPGTSRRMRLFFTQDPERKAKGRQQPLGTQEPGQPSVELQMSAPRARKALLSTQSRV